MIIIFVQNMELLIAFLNIIYLHNLNKKVNPSVH